MKKTRATKKAPTSTGYLPPVLPEWTLEDRGALLTFLSSGPGQKLQAHLLAAVIAYNEWATNQPDTVRACGEASGFRKQRDFILSLAAAQSGNHETPADTNGAAGALDHLRP